MPWPPGSSHGSWVSHNSRLTTGIDESTPLLPGASLLRLREVRVLVHDRRQSSVGDRVERAMAAEQKAGHRAIDNQEYNV